MSSSFVDWIANNQIEIAGTILGFVYVFLSVKQHIATWAFGLATSVLYIYVFFTSKFYADMALQVYYVYISIYGWMLWSRGKSKHFKGSIMRVTRLSKRKLLTLLGVSTLLFVVIYLVLKYFTDSPVPIGDAFTTSLSIVATWMLARKILEHWIIWVVVDVVSVALYLYKGLYATSILFVVYTLVAFWGYREWLCDIKKQDYGRTIG